jgi:hypothetical protein
MRNREKGNMTHTANNDGNPIVMGSRIQSRTNGFTQGTVLTVDGEWVTVKWDCDGSDYYTVGTCAYWTIKLA